MSTTIALDSPWFRLFHPEESPGAVAYRATRAATAAWNAAAQPLIVARYAATEALLERWAEVLPPTTSIGSHDQRPGEVVLVPPIAVYHAVPRPPSPHGLRWRTWMTWAPDMRTRIGRELAAEVTALPAGAEGDVCQGLPGGGALKAPAPGGRFLARREVHADGHLYVVWEAPHALVLDPAVWVQVPVDEYRAALPVYRRSPAAA